MTEEEFTQFYTKYNLNVDFVVDPLRNYLYMPKDLSYIDSIKLHIASASCIIDYDKMSINEIYLHFDTRVRITYSYEGACQIMDSDYNPQIKIIKMKNRLCELEKDFEE